jgi:solute carrier family 45 protein 1/2/4
MQPIVGVISDGWTSKWGRRRPFLIGGSVVVVVSLFVIGWTKEITHLFIGETDGDTVGSISTKHGHLFHLYNHIV